jgi:FAD/FMN-containing dehydrogenase
MVARDEYERKKKTLSDELRTARGEGQVALGKSTSNLFRHRPARHGRKIDVRRFGSVISIDPVRRVADVEGMTTYEAFLDETLRHGLMPTVVPEFKTITAGGATTGIGLEASSLNYGFVHETVEEIEVLLGDGRIVTCSRTENADLFHGFPNSYGTLGYALRLQVQLVPVRKYVKITHARYSDAATYFRDMEAVCGEKPDFVDGTMFSAHEMYITRGQLVDEAPSVSDYSYMDVYYRSIRQKETDHLAVRDFLWRWDTDWYWHSHRFGAEIPLVRRLLGRKRLRSSFFWKIRDFNHRSRVFWAVVGLFSRQETVIQDAEIPIARSAEFADFLNREVGIAPVWTCPVKTYDRASRYPLYVMEPDTLYVNFGFWGTVPSDKPESHHNRLVEAKVRELGGRKMLYSDSFYTPDDFADIYGLQAHEELKKKYDPGRTFPGLYEKCVRTNNLNNDFASGTHPPLSTALD